LRGYCCEACSISSGNYFLPIHCGSPDMANKPKPYIKP